MSILLFAALLFALLSLADRFAFFRVVAYQLSRADSPHPIRNACIYAAAYALGVLGVAVVLAHRNRVVRWTGYGVVAITVALFAGFRAANGVGFGFHEATLLFGEPDFIPDALRYFFADYAPWVAVSWAGLWLVSCYARAFVPRLASPVWLILPVLAVWANSRILEATYSKVSESPIPYRVPLISAYARDHLVPYYGERDPVPFAPHDKPLANHIVFVMDESISGGLLGINGGHPDTTPRLAALGDRLLNYGIASSASNLSSTSNLAFQSGLRPDQVPDLELRSLKNPNVFSFLQAAGFSAYLIDDQVYSGRPNNLMTRFDLDKLDGHLPLRALEPDSPIEQIDFLAIDEIERIVNTTERSFVYLIKAGAHFPYDEKSPKEGRAFYPTLVDEREGTALEKTLNSYRNALRWTVDAFLDELIRRMQGTGKSVVIVYTADHGQSLWAAVDDTAHSGRPSRWPHGIPEDPPTRQASVPLLLVGFTDPVEARLRALYAPHLRDRVSQWELFASVLELAGYSQSQLGAYHHSLFDHEAARDSRQFVSGNLFGIGGGFYDHDLVEDSVYLNDFEWTPPPTSQNPPD